MAKIVAEMPVRIDDKRVEVGETIEVDQSFADELIKSGRFKLAKISTKKKKTAEQED
tara:strand:+ start:256 stop:426 length:171 start_codon:yes stop_codon:yes gene_type:complete